MRSTLMIAAMLAAGLAGPLSHARAQDQGPTIEASPLEPLRPRLPGGTVVGPETRPSLPPGVTVATPPQGAAPGQEAPQAGTADGEAGPTPPDAAAGAPGGQQNAGQLPATGAEAAGGEAAGGDVSIGAATTAMPPEGAEPPAIDLFKRAPPGTGSTLGAQAPELIEPVARTDAPGAVLRQLDKLTGQISTFELAAGAETEVARLRVALSECRLPADGTSANNIAFLRIWDTKHPDAPPVFSGWMFADSPALSAMDHPRYDVWLIHCTTVPGSESAEKP